MYRFTKAKKEWPQDLAFQSLRHERKGDHKKESDSMEPRVVCIATGEQYFICRKLERATY